MTTDDPRYRSTARHEERRSDSPLADAIDTSVRRIVTAIVIAGGLIGMGAYFSGDETEAPTYQLTTTGDGRIVRLNTDSGSIVVCQDGQCWLMQRGSQDLEDEPPAALPKQEASPALPTPASTAENAAVPATR